MLLRSFIMRPGVTRHAKPFDTCCRGCALGCGWLVATSFSHIEPILPSKHCGLTPSNIENNVISQSECWFDWLYPPVVQPWQEKIFSFKMQVIYQRFVQVLNNWLDMFLSLFINKTRCLLWMTIQYFLDPCIANHPVVCSVARQGHDALCGRIDPSKAHMGHEPPFHGHVPWLHERPC